MKQHYKDMALRDTSNWETSDRSKRILQQFLTSDDVYVRERTRRLLGNTADYGMVLTLALTLRASPSTHNVAVDKLLEEWPAFDRIYRSGLPKQTLWNFFATMHEQAVQNRHIVKTLVKCRGREQYDSSISTLLALYINNGTAYRALEEHAQNSYLYIPFDPLRHAYDFLTVILPTTVIVDVALSRDYDEILRGLRAVGLLFNRDNMDVFCSEFGDLLNEIKLHVSTHPGYAGISVTKHVVHNLLKTASKGQVGLTIDRRQLDQTTSHIDAVTALIDVCRLLGFTGNDCAFFWFDLLCGLCVHPFTRMRAVNSQYRWYGVPWAVVKKLNDAASVRKMSLPTDVSDDVLIWFDAKDDARHLLTNGVWSSVQTKATRHACSFRDQVEDVEQRERAVCDYRTAQWYATFRDLWDSSDKSNNCMSLQIVEYESEQCDDFLLFSVDLPKCSNYLEALVANMGVYSCFQYTDTFTEETAMRTLACVFNNTIISPLEHDYSTSKFMSGLKEFLFALTHVSYDDNDDGFSLDHVYDVYEQYCREDVNVLFAWAMRAAAFYHLDEHQYVAFNKLPVDSSEASERLERFVLSMVDSDGVDPVIAVLDKAIDIYRDRLQAEQGSRKVALLNTIKHLEHVTIPRAYKYGDVLLIDASLPLLVATRASFLRVSVK